MGRSRDQTQVCVCVCTPRVRAIRPEAEWGILNRPLAFHFNSIQPLPPCEAALPLHPRLMAPSRSCPVRQLLLHCVPRWNVHRLHRCGPGNAGVVERLDEARLLAEGAESVFGFIFERRSCSSAGWAIWNDSFVLKGSKCRKWQSLHWHGCHRSAGKAASLGPVDWE